MVVLGVVLRTGKSSGKPLLLPVLKKTEATTATGAKKTGACLSVSVPFPVSPTASLLLCLAVAWWSLAVLAGLAVLAVVAEPATQAVGTSLFLICCSFEINKRHRRAP